MVGLKLQRVRAHMLTGNKNEETRHISMCKRWQVGAGMAWTQDPQWNAAACLCAHMLQHACVPTCGSMPVCPHVAMVEVVVEGVRLQTCS